MASLGGPTRGLEALGLFIINYCAVEGHVAGETRPRDLACTYPSNLSPAGLMPQGLGPGPVLAKVAR